GDVVPARAWCRSTQPKAPAPPRSRGNPIPLRASAAPHDRVRSSIRAPFASWLLPALAPATSARARLLLAPAPPLGVARDAVAGVHPFAPRRAPDSSLPRTATRVHSCS